MILERFFHLSACAFVLSSMVYAQAQTSCNNSDSTAPCFANNTDILNGRNSLLPDDDVAVSGLFTNSKNSLQTYADVFLTLNGNFNSTIGSGLTGSGWTSNSIEINARMFNQTAPQIVSAVSSSAGGSVVLEHSTQPVPPMQILDGSSQIYGISGDFLGYGVDQVVIAGLRQDPPGRQILSFDGLMAKDQNNLSAGFLTGPMSGGVSNPSSVVAITSGIFTDWRQGQPRPHAQIAVVSGNPANGRGLTLSLYGMGTTSDPFGFSTGKSINLQLPKGNGVNVQSVAVTAGRFAGSGHDQLVIAFADVTENVQVITVDFDANGNPVQKATSDTGRPVTAQNGYGPAVWLAKARFDWFGNADQAALAINPGGNLAQVSTIRVISFDAGMKVTFGEVLGSSGGQSCHFGLAAGRFDHMQPNTAPPPALQVDPAPQLSNMTSDCRFSSGETLLNIYDVSGPENNYKILLSTYTPIGGQGQGIVVPAYVSSIPTALAVSIAAGDMQGRSMLLGPPEKSVIAKHKQPDMVLGVPPMHVDWITSAVGNVPQVLNISVFPSLFNTSYSSQSGQSVSVHQSGTTSYTYGTKESASEKISYGIPGLDSISAQSKQAASQLHQNSISKNFNTYSGQTEAFSTRTTFDDIISFTNSQMNIYSYRLVGKCDPSQGAPGLEGCPAGTKPIYLQLSGPDNIQYDSAFEGRNVEWYQPVQEPGNLFSYPPNVQQLQANLSGGTTFQPLTQPETWDSQTVSATSANWTQGGGQGVTSGTTTTHNFDVNSSVSGSVNFFGFGAGASVGFDYNSSKSVSTLNQSTSTVSASQGITLNHGVEGGPITSDVYDYKGQSFIYGQQAPTGTVQTDATPNTDVKAQGYIAVGHTADVLSGGNFWTQAYALTPDIALNHPQRWIQKQSAGSRPQQVMFNCPVGYTSSLTSPLCSSAPTKLTPRNVANTVFYQMKGLFVTPGGTFDGPQITRTALGDKVNLRVRVYNYSAAQYTGNPTLHVQFYAQPWNGTVGEFASVPGDPTDFAKAVYLGEGTDVQGGSLTLVPPYCGGAGTNGDPCPNSQVRNWEYAYATWDTSKGGVTGNSTWKFWVVTWLEQGGQLVGEISGHGLESLPQQAPYNSLADVPIEPYSNNLGFYNQTFLVAGPTNLTSTVAAKQQKPRLIISGVGLPYVDKALRDRPVTVLAKLRSTGADISADAYYYDGNPDKDGIPFDVQQIDRIPSGDGYSDNAVFTPKTCGVHWIYVRAIPFDGSIAPAKTLTAFNVTSDPLPEVEGLISYVQAMPAPAGVKQQLLIPLLAAQKAYKQDRPILGNIALETFKIAVQINQRQIPAESLTAIKDEIKEIQECLW